MRVCELHSFFGIELHSFEGKWAVDLLNRVESPLRGTEPSQKAIHQEGVLCSTKDCITLFGSAISSMKFPSPSCVSHVLGAAFPRARVAMKHLEHVEISLYIPRASKDATMPSRSRKDEPLSLVYAITTFHGLSRSLLFTAVAWQKRSALDELECMAET